MTQSSAPLDAKKRRILFFPFKSPAIRHNRLALLLPFSPKGFVWLGICLGCLDSVEFINATTGHRLLYSNLALRSKTLVAYLQTMIGFSKGDTAFMLSSNLIQIPVLQKALLVSLSQCCYHSSQSNQPQI